MRQAQSSGSPSLQRQVFLVNSCLLNSMNIRFLFRLSDFTNQFNWNSPKFSRSQLANSSLSTTPTRLRFTALTVGYFVQSSSRLHRPKASQARIILLCCLEIAFSSPARMKQQHAAALSPLTSTSSGASSISLSSLMQASNYFSGLCLRYYILRSQSLSRSAGRVFSLPRWGECPRPCAGEDQVILAALNLTSVIKNRRVFHRISKSRLDIFVSSPQAIRYDIFVSSLPKLTCLYSLIRRQDISNYYIMKATFLRVTELKANFLKNFDTFGSMDPFFRLTCGPNATKTETLKGQAVVFKLSFNVRIDRETELKIAGFEEDVTESQFCGDCRIKLAELHGKTSYSFTLLLEGQKTCEGTITYSFAEQTIEVSTKSELTFYNIKLSLEKTSELLGLGGVDPFLVMTSGKQTAKTEVVEDMKGPIEWMEPIKLSCEESIQCDVFDSNIMRNKVMGRGEISSSSLQNQGQLTVKLLDQNKAKVGYLELRYVNSNLDLVQLKKLQEQQRLKQEAELLEKKKRAEAKQKERLQAIEKQKQRLQILQKQQQILAPIYLGKFSVTGLTSKEAEEQAMAICTIQYNKVQTKLQQKPTEACWDQSFKLESVDKKFEPLSFKVVLRNVLGSTQLSTKDIDPLVLADTGKEYSAPLLNSGGVKCGSLNFAYARAEIAKAAPATRKMESLRIEETRLLIHESSTVFDQLSNSVSVRYQCGSSQSLPSVPIESLRTVWDTPVHFKTPEDKLRITVVDSLGSFKGEAELRDLNTLKEAGFAKLQLKSEKLQVATLVLKYAKDKPALEAPQQQKEAQFEISRIQVDLKCKYVVCSTSGKDSKRTELDKQPTQNSVFKKKLRFPLSAMKKLSLVLGPDQAKGEVKLSQLDGLAGGRQAGTCTLPLEMKGGAKTKALVSYRLVQAPKQEFKIESLPEQRIATPPRQVPLPQFYEGKSMRERELMKEREREKEFRINNQTLKQNKSMASLNRLPQNYGDKIYDKQSAYTMQNTIVSYTIPKGARFNSRVEVIEPSYYVANSINKSKYQITTLGYGNRRPYPQWMERNMRELPAPGAYNLVQTSKPFDIKGKTFGMPHACYEKVLIKEEKNQSMSSFRRSDVSQVSQSGPGVGPVPGGLVAQRTNYHFLPKMKY